MLSISSMHCLLGNILLLISLHLMKSYRDSLSNGKDLDRAVELLEQTSIMIAIFRDQRLITTRDDLRLSQIRNIISVFSIVSANSFLIFSAIFGCRCDSVTL
jgi:DNA gyrase inhibitor GyrI